MLNAIETKQNTKWRHVTSRSQRNVRDTWGELDVTRDTWDELVDGSGGFVRRRHAHSSVLLPPSLAVLTRPMTVCLPGMAKRDGETPTGGRLTAAIAGRIRMKRVKNNVGAGTH